MNKTEKREKELMEEEKINNRKMSSEEYEKAKEIVIETMMNMITRIYTEN